MLVRLTRLKGYDLGQGLRGSEFGAETFAHQRGLGSNEEKERFQVSSYQEVSPFKIHRMSV